LTGLSYHYNESQPTKLVSGFGISNALPNNLFEDDSCISSLCTNREDFPKVSKFQLAEDNASYDGPEAYQSMNILKNLDLYFNTYVFPSPVPHYAGEEEDMMNDDEAWKKVSIRYPRIQLRPEDGRGLEAALKKKLPVPIGEEATFRDALWPHAVARYSYQDL
jgi:hypothetical protein